MPSLRMMHVPVSDDINGRRLQIVLSSIGMNFDAKER
jgi:hypothetical protein